MRLQGSNLLSPGWHQQASQGAHLRANLFALPDALSASPQEGILPECGTRMRRQPPLVLSRAPTGFCFALSRRLSAGGTGRPGDAQVSPRSPQETSWPPCPVRKHWTLRPKLSYMLLLSFLEESPPFCVPTLINTLFFFLEKSSLGNHHFVGSNTTCF